MNLSPIDVAAHERLGIDAALLETARVRRIASAEAYAYGIRWRGDLAGLLYPRVDPRTNNVVGYRVRRDHPDVEGGKTTNKYISSLDRQRLYLTCVSVAMLGDSTVPVVFVESEKSSLMLASVAMRTRRGICAIATGGCWGWRGRVGKAPAPDGGDADEKGPLSDFDILDLEGREVMVWFDANVATNASVKAAQRALIGEIAKRKGRPKIVTMPVITGINGPDDLRAHRDDPAVLELLDRAAVPEAGSYRGARTQRVIVVELAR